MAIAIDSTSNGNSSGSSTTVSHTCTGSNLILWVATYTAGGDNMTSVTYNAVAMTLLGKTAMDSGYYMYLHYLAGPATGANNIVFNRSGSGDTDLVAASYTGAAQTGIPDASVINTTVAAQTSLTQTVTVVAANSWLVGAWRNDASIWTAGTNTLERSVNPVATAYSIMDSNGGQATGSRSMTATCSSANVTGIMASFAPFTTSIKTVDGLAVASVKTVDGLAIASVKTINGLV